MNTSPSLSPLPFSLHPHCVFKYFIHEYLTLYFGWITPINLHIYACEPPSFRTLIPFCHIFFFSLLLFGFALFSLRGSVFSTKKKSTVCVIRASHHLDVSVCVCVSFRLIKVKARKLENPMWSSFYFRCALSDNRPTERYVSVNQIKYYNLFKCYRNSLSSNGKKTYVYRVINLNSIFHACEEEETSRRNDDAFLVSEHWTSVNMA